jgi:hypothetical protein
MTAMPDCAVAPREWLRGETSARGVFFFRVLLAGALSAYFCQHAVHSASLVAAGGLLHLPSYEVRGLSDPLSFSAVPATVWRGVFLTVAAASVGTIAGRFARASSVVTLLGAVITYRSLLPVAYIDDSCACWAALFLFLLPTPRPVAPLARRCGATVSGFSVLSLLVLVLVVDASGAVLKCSGLRPASMQPVLLVIRIVAVALVAPSIRLRAVAAFTFALIHAYLGWTTPLHFTHFVFASTCVLSWRHGATQGTAPPHDFGAIVAPAAVALVGVGGLALWTGPGRAVTASQRILLDLGLIPTSDMGATTQQSPLPLVFETPGAQQEIVTAWVDTSTVRQAILQQYLQKPSATRVGSLLVASLARRYCLAHSTSDVALLAPGATQVVATFACRDGEVAPTGHQY